MIPSGYKQTEIGVIPEDWNCVAAKHLMKIETGSRNTEHKTDTGKYPFFVRSQKVERIDTYHYDCEAVLTAGDGVGTGKIFHHYIGKFDAHQRVYVMSNFNGITGKYFYNYFSENFGNEVSKYTAKSSVDSVRRDMIAEMLIPTPPVTEQERIAEALSDVDSMISSLEKLIIKKKAVKQGTMQELLTGKKRLPGFTGEWRYYKLGFVCSILNGDRGINYPKETEMTSYGVPFINAGHIKNNAISYKNMDYISYDHYQRLGGAKLKTGDILFCLRGSLGKYAMFNNNEGAPASSLCVIRTNNALKAEYLFHLLGTNMIQNQVVNANSGSSQPNISADNIKHFEIFIPKHINEQTVISSILSNMDNEIEALEQKLEKTRQIKQGMMQQLLTGKIRLV